MAFNINEIKSQLTFGGAKASLFQVQITNPVNAIADLKTPFMVQAAAIPESTLGTIEIPYFGRKVKIGGDRTFAESDGARDHRRRGSFGGPLSREGWRQRQ